MLSGRSSPEAAKIQELYQRRLGRKKCRDRQEVRSKLSISLSIFLVVLQMIISKCVCFIKIFVLPTIFSQDPGDEGRMLLADVVSVLHGQNHGFF